MEPHRNPVVATISNNHEPEVAAWGNNGYAVADGGYVYTSDSGATWHKVSIFTGSGGVCRRLGNQCGCHPRRD